MAYYKVFNEKAEEFFRDLIEGFPSMPEYDKVVQELRTMKGGFSLLKNVDEKQPQRIFRDYLLASYRDKLVSEDESFFLEKTDFDIVSKRVEYWMDFIEKIKTAWSSMNEDNKKIIWKYFKVLVYFSDKCDGC